MTRRERLARAAVARCPEAREVVLGMLTGCTPCDVCSLLAITPERFADLVRRAFP